MHGRKNRRMFPQRESVSAPCALTKALLTLFVGAFLLVCQPRVGDFVASHLPNRESKLLNVGAFFDGVIASRSPKCADTQCEIRLLTGRVWNDPYKRNVFLRAMDRSIVLHDVPTAGSFLIRSPPSRTVA
jgi:hypothetical protein